MYITKETKWQLSYHCHDNSYAAGPVLITTKIPRFHLAQGSSTPNNLTGKVKTMREQCLFRGRPPVPLKKVSNGDIWFFTERDCNQGCCHGNNIVGVILFLLWFSNYWIEWGRVGYEEFCRSRRVLSTEAEGRGGSEICRILHILRKPNSIIALLFIQNISSFLKEFRHYDLCSAHQI